MTELSDRVSRLEGAYEHHSHQSRYRRSQNRDCQPSKQGYRHTNRRDRRGGCAFQIPPQLESRGRLLASGRLRIARGVFA